MIVTAESEEPRQKVSIGFEVHAPKPLILAIHPRALHMAFRLFT